jgi:hypothetical protein
MVIPYKFWKIGTTTILGASAFTIWTIDSAQAFFPPLPMDTGPVTILPPPPQPVIPTNPNIPVVTPVVPVVPPPPFVPPPPVIPPTVPVLPLTPPEVPVVPQTVPEPTTVVSSLLGLGVLGAARWKRRQRNNSASAESTPMDD